MTPAGAKTSSDAPQRAALPDTPTCSIEEAAQVAGVSAWALYKAVRAGESPFPVIRIGRRIRVLVAPLRRALGIDTDGDKR